MNLVNSFDPHASSLVSFGVNTLLISAAGIDGALARKLAGLGCHIETCEELYSAIDLVMDDPSGYELIVIDCDTAGGMALGRRAHSLLEVTGRCIPVILVSRECHEQSFPASRYEPTLLRAPLSSVSLRVGFEHVMQERMLLTHTI